MNTFYKDHNIDIERINSKEIEYYVTASSTDSVLFGSYNDGKNVFQALRDIKTRIDNGNICCEFKRHSNDVFEMAGDCSDDNEKEMSIKSQMSLAFVIGLTVFIPLVILMK